MRARLRDYLRTRDPSAPPPDIIAWAAASLYVSARQGTARPGFYDARVTPYIIDILRDIADPDIREISLCTGAQVGKSQALLVAMAYLWAFAPGPTMVVQPTDDDVRAFSEKRVKPTLEDSEALAPLIPPNRKKLFRAADYTLATCSVFLRGAGSPSKLASWPIRYVFLDETDKYPEAFTREGDPVELIRQRTKTYDGIHKIISDSTPTTEAGVIWRQFLEGDQRELFVTCEHCGASQPLLFKDVKFDNSDDLTPPEIARTARLVCRACGTSYDTPGKNRLVARATWQPTAKPKASGTRSYHLQSIASPWVSLEALTERFIRAKRAGAAQLRVFVNSELAEPWLDAEENLLGTRLQTLELDYPQGGSFPGDDPPELRARFAGVDVQKGYLVLVIREFAPGGASGLVLQSRVADFVELDHLATEYKVSLTCIDARYRNDEVVAACAHYPDFIPCYGRPRFADGLLWSQRQQTLSGARAGAGDITLTHVFYDQSALFEFVAQGLRGERPWHLYKGATLDPVYCKEISAKQKVAGIWQADPSVDDHYADAEKLAMLAALISNYLIAPPAEEISPTDKVTV